MYAPAACSNGACAHRPPERMTVGTRETTLTGAYQGGSERECWRRSRLERTARTRHWQLHGEP